MDKSALLARIHTDLQESPEFMRACEAVIAFLESHHAEALRHISFAAISSAAGLPSPEDAIPVAQYLSSSKVHVLEKCYFLVVDGEEFDISAEDVRQANEDRVLYHPDRGEPIPDFEHSLYLYFTPSESVKDIVGHAA